MAHSSGGDARRSSPVVVTAPPLVARHQPLAARERAATAVACVYAYCAALTERR